MNVEQVWHATPDGGEGLMALVIRRVGADAPPGVTFYTDRDSQQQVGYIKYPAGHVIPRHVHTPIARHVNTTTEVLFVRLGRLCVHVYTSGGNPVGTTILETGDAVVLLRGGHGFEVLEDVELLEVRQGPYLGYDDKTRF